MRLTTYRARLMCLSAMLGLGLPAISLAETPGWFVEADARAVDAKGLVSGFTLDDDDTGASLTFGYAFNRYFSVQAGLHDLGSHFATDCPPPLVCLVQNVDEVDITAFSVSATGTWPVTDRLEVFGTLGVVDWDADFDRFDRDESDQDLMYGAGIAWWLTPNWRLSAAYEEVDFDLETVNLGLRFQF